MTVRNLQAFRYRKTVSTSSMFVAVITVQTLKILSASIRHSCPCRRAFRFGPCLSLAARRRLLAKAMSPCSHRRATALCFQESADCGGRQLMGPLRRSDFSSHAANRVHPNSHQTDRNWHLFRIAAIIHSSAFIPMIQHPFCISPHRPRVIRTRSGLPTANGSSSFADQVTAEHQNQSSNTTTGLGSLDGGHHNWGGPPTVEESLHSPRLTFVNRRRR